MLTYQHAAAVARRWREGADLPATEYDVFCIVIVDAVNAALTEASRVVPEASEKINALKLEID